MSNILRQRILNELRISLKEDKVEDLATLRGFEERYNARNIQGTSEKEKAKEAFIRIKAAGTDPYLCDHFPIVCKEVQGTSASTQTSATPAGQLPTACPNNAQPIASNADGTQKCPDGTNIAAPAADAQPATAPGTFDQKTRSFKCPDQTSVANFQNWVKANSKTPQGKSIKADGAFGQKTFMAAKSLGNAVLNFAMYKSIDDFKDPAKLTQICTALASDARFKTAAKPAAPAAPATAAVKESIIKELTFLAKEGKKAGIDKNIYLNVLRALKEQNEMIPSSEERGAIVPYKQRAVDAEIIKDPEVVKVFKRAKKAKTDGNPEADRLERILMQMMKEKGGSNILINNTSNATSNPNVSLSDVGNAAATGGSVSGSGNATVTQTQKGGGGGKKRKKKDDGDLGPVEPTPPKPRPKPTPGPTPTPEPTPTPGPTPSPEPTPVPKKMGKGGKFALAALAATAIGAGLFNKFKSSTPEIQDAVRKASKNPCGLGNFIKAQLDSKYIADEESEAMVSIARAYKQRCTQENNTCWCKKALECFPEYKQQINEKWSTMLDKQKSDKIEIINIFDEFASMPKCVPVAEGTTCPDGTPAPDGDVTKCKKSPTPEPDGKTKCVKCNVRKGCKGQYVTELQQAVGQAIQSGKLKVDNNKMLLDFQAETKANTYGEATEYFVRRFQASARTLVVDGIAGPKTFGKLGIKCPSGGGGKRGGDEDKGGGENPPAPQPEKITVDADGDWRIVLTGDPASQRKMLCKTADNFASQVSVDELQAMPEDKKRKITASLNYLYTNGDDTCKKVAKNGLMRFSQAVSPQSFQESRKLNYENYYDSKKEKEANLLFEKLIKKL